jgi:hypothetical protein
MSRIALVAFALAIAVASLDFARAQPQAQQYGIGRPATPDEIKTETSPWLQTERDCPKVMAPSNKVARFTTVVVLSVMATAVKGSTATPHTLDGEGRSRAKTRIDGW